MMFPEISKALNILSLDEEANYTDVEKAFRKLALKYHPDKCKEDKKLSCRDKFIEINAAKQILKDYFMGKYKRPSINKNKKKMKVYKNYIEHAKRFYADLFGTPDI